MTSPPPMRKFSVVEIQIDWLSSGQRRGVERISRVTKEHS